LRERKRKEGEEKEKKQKRAMMMKTTKRTIHISIGSVERFIGSRIQKNRKRKNDFIFFVSFISSFSSSPSF
jgi:hypothetical protein